MPADILSQPTKCHVRDNIDDSVIEIIREKVCVKDSIHFHPADNKYYCLFHLPTHEKNISKFNRVFNERLRVIKEQIVEIKKLTKDEQAEALNELSYDFRYVFFPSQFYIMRQTFEVMADFGWTTFAQTAFFNLTTFTRDANFTSATFTKNAYFSSTAFIQKAYFNSATFSLDVYFNSAIFIQEVYFSDAKFIQNASFISPKNSEPTLFVNDAFFNLAKFAQDAHFNSTIFFQNAYFNSAKFLESSQIFFQQTKFCNKTIYRSADFCGYVRFEGNKSENVFLGKNNVLAIKKDTGKRLEELKQNLIAKNIDFQVSVNFKENQEAMLDLQYARFENEERISFNAIRLRPSWFINTKPNEFTFLNCSWENVNRFLVGIKDEIKYCGEFFEVDNPEYLLKESIKNLAVNSEEKNSFEEASSFRKVVFEIQRIENTKRVKDWFKNSILFRKKIYCSIFSVKFYKELGLLSKEVFKELGSLPSLIIYWLYKWTSGYGESIGGTLLILIIILFSFSLLFTKIQFQVCPSDKPITISITNKLCEERPLYFGEGIRHSLATATFQTVEYRKPITGWGETWVILEKILAPLQAALLALAIRRKFMR